MSFGVGGGVNLGSATGYLFVDPKGVQRGLNQAAAEFNRFEKATQRVGQSMARSMDATANAMRAQRTFSPTNITALKNAQAATISTLAGATKEFANQHRIRDQILKNHSANVIAEANKIKAAKTQSSRALKDLVAAEQRMLRSQANLANAMQRGASGRSLGGFKGALTRDLNDIAKFKAEIGRLAGEVATANAKMASSGLDASKALRASHDAEAQAVRNVSNQLTKQNDLRRQLARDSGISSLGKFADDAEKASTRYIRATQAMLTVQDKLDDVRRRAASTIDPTSLSKLADREEQLVQRKARLSDIAIQSRRALEASETQFTQRFSAEVDKRTKIAEREAAAAKAAQAEQSRLAKQRVVSKSVDFAVKGAIALGAAIAVSTAQFVSFEQAMLQVQSVSQDSDAALAQMTTRVRELSIELGQSPTELAQGLYTIVQAGFKGQEAMSILETAAKAAVAGLTDVDTAARPLIAVMSAYGAAAGSASEISDVLFESVTAGVFSFKDLASQIGDNVPLAAQMGVSIQELAASYVVLTKQGNSLSESTTQINGIMRAFLKPTTALQKVLEEAGFSTGALAVEQLGLSGAMELALRAANGNNDALADMFPLIRGLRGVVALSVRDWKDYDAALTQVTGASEGVGRTQETLAKQMESTAFQLRVAREEIRGAAISLGQEFAPAVVNLAQILGSAAQAVAQFNADTGGMAANLITFGFASSVAFVGMAKLIGSIRGAIDIFRDLRVAILASNRAMMLVRLSPILIVFTALAAVTANLIRAHRDHAQAVKDLKQSYVDATDAIEQMKLAGADILDIKAQTDLEANFVKTTEALQERKKVLEELLEKQTQLRQDMDPNLAGGPKVQPIIDFVDSLEAELAVLDVVEAKLAEGHQAMIAALLEPNVDIQLLTGTFQRLNDELARTGDIDKWLAGIADVTGNIGTFVDHTKLAEQAAGVLGDELEDTAEKLTTVAEFFKAATLDSEAFRESVADTITSARELVGLDVGADDPFGFVSATKGLKSKNIFDQLIKLTKLRETDLVNLSPSTLEAFKLADQLERVKAKLAELDTQFQQNAEDISLWEGRVNLLDETLGENIDTLSDYERQLAAGEITQEEFNEAVSSGEAHVAMAELDRLLDEGRISQKQYNDIKEAAIFLHERSAEALQDERAQQALLIPQLAEYVKQQDALNGQLGELDPNAQARVQALQSEAVQMAINTAIMLKMLEAMNLIPEGVATQFIADVSAYDPVIGAVFDDIGLLKDESPVDIEIAASGRDAEALGQHLTNLKQKLFELRSAGEKLEFLHQAGRISDPEFLKQLEELRVAREAIEGDIDATELVIDTGGTFADLEAIDGLINNIKQTSKGGFVIDVDSVEAAAQLREILGIEIGDKRFKITIDGIEGDTSLDKELARRIRKSAAAAGFSGFENGDFVANFRAKVTAEDTSASERLSEIAFMIKAITGDENAVSVGVNTKAAETAILSLTGYIDRTLLTPDFIAYLDANADGALDATELAILATEGFDGVYTAYLFAEATEAQTALKEVDGVKTEVLEDGTLVITADSKEALEKFTELNNQVLDGKVFPVDVELRMGSDVDATGIPELAGDAAGETSIEIGVTVDTSQAETDLQTFTDTTLPNTQTLASTAATTIGTAVKEGISTGMSGVVSDTEATMGSVVGAMDRSGETWNIGFNTGWNLGDGIRAGIEATVGAIAAAAANAVNTAEAAARAAADSKSPSKLFAKLGHDLMLGVAMGVENGENMLSDSIQKSMTASFARFPSVTLTQSLAGGVPMSPAIISSAGGGDVYNVSMDVTVPAGNFREWIGTVEFVQDIKRGFGTTLAGSRSR